eukprot:1274358-Rhodomonas_salina.1
MTRAPRRRQCVGTSTGPTAVVLLVEQQQQQQPQQQQPQPQSQPQQQQQHQQQHQQEHRACVSAPPNPSLPPPCSAQNAPVTSAAGWRKSRKKACSPYCAFATGLAAMTARMTLNIWASNHTPASMPSLSMKQSPRFLAK